MSPEPPVLVYDGECPFCSAYARLVRLKATLGTLRLVDARSDDPVVEEVRAAGLDLDQGMVLKLDGALYHGDRCLQMIALMSTPSGTFNRVTRALFASPRLSRALYPLLRAGRNATLRLLGHRRISASTS